MSASLQRFPVIIGPTAGGKSALAVEVALRIGFSPLRSSPLGEVPPSAAAEGTTRPSTSTAPRSAGGDRHAQRIEGVVEREAPSGFEDSATSPFGEEPREEDRRGEILTADAFQVYRGMDIGTAKPTHEERRGVKHHLIDLVDPGERFTVADWLAAADSALADVRARGHVPIVVGGTHLYVKSFLEGMFEGPGEDAAIREELRGWEVGALRRELERVDASTARKLHPNDIRRTIRALEVFRLTGTPISELQQQWDREDHRRRDCVLIGIEWPVEELNCRINARVKDMIERGLVDEARGLWQCSSRAESERSQAREALGYKQLFEHFEGRCSLEEAIEQVKIETRRFAKNQRTWMRRLRLFPGAVWIDAATTPLEEWAGIVVGVCESPR